MVAKWLLNAGMLFALGTSPVWAEEAEPSPTPLPDPAFLSLPSHDVEIFRAPEKIRTGDGLILKVPGSDPKLGLALEKEAETLEDEGFIAEPLPEVEPGQKEFRFRVTPIKPGNLTLPSIGLKDAEGKLLGRTNPFTLSVQSSIKPEDKTPTEPVPLRPPVALAFPWWALALGAALAIVVFGVVFYLFKRLRKQKTPEPVEPPKAILPEDEEAQLALAKLEASGPLKRGDFKLHYFALSEILKTYLGRRYRFDALESTSHEVVQHLDERKNLPENAIDRVETVFEKLDLVKFTDHVPLPTEGWDLLREIRELVTSTRRIPQPEPILPKGSQ